MDFEYFLGTIYYKSNNERKHTNTVLIKATSREEAANGLKKNFFNKGMSEDNFIKIEIHNTIDCTQNEKR